MHLQNRLKCNLLAACSRYWGLNAGNCCEEEKGGLQTKSQDEKKRKAEETGFAEPG